MQYVRVTEAELARLRELVIDDPNGAYDWVDELADDSDERTLDTDKAWAAIAYLLRQLGTAPVDPVNGGEELTPDEWGYGPPRWLSVAAVAAAATYLDNTPFGALEPHLDPVRMEGIYPEIWNEEWAGDYVRRWYESLVEFFVATAADRDALIVYLS